MKKMRESILIKLRVKLRSKPIGELCVDVYQTGPHVCCTSLGNMVMGNASFDTVRGESLSAEKVPIISIMQENPMQCLTTLYCGFELHHPFIFSLKFLHL